MEGWIKLHRQIQDNPLWICEPFTRGQAWIDLLLLANHKPSYYYKRNIKIDVNRGQVARSEVELADRWKWSRSKVRKFINDLEKEQQVIQHKTNVTQLITIVKYDEYQKKGQQDEQQQDSKKTPKEQQQDTYNNVYNYRMIKNILLSKIDVSILDAETKQYFEIAESFYKLFEKNLIDAGASTKTLEKAKGTWVNDVRLMITQDGVTVDQLRKAWHYLQKDEFWKKNILSMSTLRKQFSKLILASNYESNKRNPKEGTTWDELAEVIRKNTADLPTG